MKHMRIACWDTLLIMGEGTGSLGSSRQQTNPNLSSNRSWELSGSIYFFDFGEQGWANPLFKRV